MKKNAIATNLRLTTPPLKNFQTQNSQATALTLNPTCPLPHQSTTGQAPQESIRHILLGSPGAIRQTIHLLHTLHYAETVLWTPILHVEEPLTITPEQGEAMSLLRRLV